MTISFGGLSTGIDSNSIIDQMLAIARQPIDRLNAQKDDLGTMLDAAKNFNSKLSSLLAKADVLDTPLTLLANTVTTSSADYFTATASSSATPGNYEIKVGRLAQVEKSVFSGVVDRNTTSFGTGSIIINNDALDAPVSVDIDSDHSTLQGIRDAINAKSSDLGVTASIINDGSGTPYRLVLTGKAVGNANITIDASGLTGGATFPDKDTAVSRDAQQAMIQVDGVTVTSDTNTLTEAISGVSITLTHADPAFDPDTLNWSEVAGTTTNVSTDNSGIKTKITDFVTAFNDVVKAAGADALASDGGVRSILGLLRSKLTNSVDGVGLYQLGIKTQKDGTLKVDNTKLDAAIENDLAGVESLLAGASGEDGVADLVKKSLDRYTNAITGFLAGRQNSYDSSIRRMDNEIARNEFRIDNLEKQLVAKFSAMESLVNSLNSQGSYLTQQMKSLSGGN